MPRIKICGITNLEDGLNAVKLGADYIGFIFYEKSIRDISPEHAREISRRLNCVKKVGVFVNKSQEAVRNVADYAYLDVLQFHGDEYPEYCRGFRNKEVWKAIRVKDESSLVAIHDYPVSGVVLDAYHDSKIGGTGMTFDWDIVLSAKKYGKKIILAGGLNAQNVREAIAKINPDTVDVSSGVEQSKGKKSYEKMMAFIEAARTPSVLLKIAAEKKNEVDALYAAGDAKKYKQSAKIRNRKSFYDAITASRTTNSPNLIAEFKITSPSNVRKGNPDFREVAVPEEIARIYEKYGACAISVLTDSHFKGKLNHLQKIRESVNLPLLRKDFIIDPVQIYESQAYGADALLLIAAILDRDKIKEYISIADSLGMDCLVESHNQSEIIKSINAGARIIGINNRNLHNFDTNINTTLKLMNDVPSEIPIVTESGILTYENIEHLSDKRINAMLVGETLMKAHSVRDKMYELLGKIKVQT